MKRITASVKKIDANNFRLRFFNGDSLKDPIGPAYKEDIIEVSKRIAGMSRAIGKKNLRVFFS